MLFYGCHIFEIQLAFHKHGLPHSACTTYDVTFRGSSQGSNQTSIQKYIRMTMTVKTQKGVGSSGPHSHPLGSWRGLLLPAGSALSCPGQLGVACGLPGLLPGHYPPLLGDRRPGPMPFPKFPLTVNVPLLPPSPHPLPIKPRSLPALAEELSTPTGKTTVHRGS